MTEPLPPRAALLMCFFEVLNQTDACYCVMNNYEDLPRIIPSDVDIAINPAFFAKLDQFIAAFAAKNAVSVVQKIWHGNRKCAYILATGTPRNRAFLQLDFFVEFSIKTCPNLIVSADLLAECRPYGLFFIPRPDVERVFTVMRRLFKDDWSARQVARVQELSRRIIGEPWLPKRFGWLQQSLDQANAGDVTGLAAKRAADWARLKKSATSGLSLGAKLRNLAWQSRRGLARLRDETGNLSIVIGTIEGEAEALGALEMVFHRRLIIDETWLEKHRGNLRLVARIKLLKQRKGLLLVRLGEKTPKTERLMARLHRLGMVDQVLLGAAASTAQKAKWAAVRAPDGPAMIEAILATQIAKTKTALSRRGTQTSRRENG